MSWEIGLKYINIFLARWSGDIIYSDNVYSKNIPKFSHVFPFFYKITNLYTFIYFLGLSNKNESNMKGLIRLREYKEL